MPISTSEWNEMSKRNSREKYGVEDIEIDFMDNNVCRSESRTLYTRTTNVFGSTKVSSRTIQSPVVRWKANGITYTAVLPLKIRTVERSSWFSTTREEVIDERAMEREAMRIISGVSRW